MGLLRRARARVRAALEPCWKKMNHPMGRLATCPCRSSSSSSPAPLVPRPERESAMTLTQLRKLPHTALMAVWTLGLQPPATARGGSSPPEVRLCGPPLSSREHAALSDPEVSSTTLVEGQMESLDAFIRAYGYPALFVVMGDRTVRPTAGRRAPSLGARRLGRTAHLCVARGSSRSRERWRGISSGTRSDAEVDSGYKSDCVASMSRTRAFGVGRITFARRGASALVIAKVLPGLNGIGQPLAGALGMPRLRS